MQKTCSTILRDLLNIEVLTVAFYRLKNIRDALMPSKLKIYEEAICKVSSHFKNITLEHCINEINYNKLRQQDIDKEKDNLASEIQRLNNFTKQASNKIMIYNPYTKKHCWRHLQ